MHAPSDVTFVERDGPEAETALTRLQARLRRTGTASRLLRSHARADLRLLVVEGAAHLSDDDVRGARVWRFVAVAPSAAGTGAPTNPPAAEGETAS